MWLRDGRMTPQAAQVLDVLRRASDHGLRPADYRIDLATDDLDAVLIGRADLPMRQRFEVLLSSAATRFVSDLHDGRIDPQRAGFRLPAVQVRFDVQLAVRRLASSRDVAATIESIEPEPMPYKRLKRALAQYRRVADAPGLERLPALPAKSLALGDEYEGAPQLRQLLAAVGDLPSTEGAWVEHDRTIDVHIAAALRSFQRRHGLEADGVIGPRTFLALTTPLEQRVRQIELSMERWRWLTRVGRPDILVNIPQFMLYALPSRTERGAEVIQMPVVVGQDYPHTRTPVFASAITQVVFQPYWDIPPGILSRELLPRIQKDPTLLDRLGMELVPAQGDGTLVQTVTAEAIAALAAGRLRLRQRPGPSNPLGAVKFSMPNEYSVSLHASPERALFERSQRTFSHGCIRVSEPAELATYVLRRAGERWDHATIEAALSGAETLGVPLTRPVQVIVFYSTALATESDGVLFFADVYGHDRKLQDLLD
jgi:L,D-transpeptidase YcbB